MPKKANRSKKISGIVERTRPESKPLGADEQFSADYTVTSTTDGGGRVLTDVEVILVFWGSFWTATPAPSPSSDEYKQAIIGILTGPYMGGLRQYRGAAQGTLIFTDLNDNTSPADQYTDDDVKAMLKDRLDNTSMPPPTSGHNRFYAVIVPPGINNKLTTTQNFVGQHQSFTYKGVTGYYAWVDNTGSLTGHNCATKVFSHELIEACTNPDVDTLNNSILVNGTNPDGSTVTNDEIGDTCNNQFATVDVNGVSCSVQAYWSKADNACILPTGTLTFLVDKDTFGKDEVQDVINTSGGTFEQAFWLVVDGFSKNTFSSLNVTVPAPFGAFANLGGVSIAQNPNIDFENGADPDAQQRIRIPFDITFTSAALANFPASGSRTFELDAVLATDSNPVPGGTASTLFELVAGADPYFTNVDPTQNNVFYLSQDLRVFTATPGLSQHPVPGAPAFATDSVNGAFTYIQDLLSFLNNNFSDPAGADPFNSILPSQGGALQADSSVTPFTLQLGSGFPPTFNIFNNYNFAVARVRMRGTAGPAGEANNARVFFRLFVTQSPDTDYQTGTTYPFNPDPAGLPGSPQVGAGHVTLPFFATGNLSGNTDYDNGGVNNRDIEIASGKDSIWAYYGCFLNLYDPANVIDGKQALAWLAGTHHCLVAQIAFDDAPIFTGARPEASDKLAQRNLQVTVSDNPGPASTHRVPQTFDIRPSATVSRKTLVDELMIDWGRVPHGSVASIYWPQVQASDVLALASQLYPAHSLTAGDTNTIQCKITGGVTYVPIPMNAGENFAGLLTLDLPPTVVTGEQFNVVVRRVGRQVSRRDVSIQKPAPTRDTNPSAVVQRRPFIWRYVIGTFQVKIPVSTSAVMLRPEEDTLAIMKWRLQQTEPSNRWFAVLQRYVAIVADRVAGLGGDPNAIPPSPNGAPVNVPSPCLDVVEYTGRIAEIFFDCFGELEGFALADCCTAHSFRTRERQVGELLMRAFRDRLPLSVFALKHDRSRIHRLIIRG
jgi:hypothetical protein